MLVKFRLHRIAAKRSYSNYTKFRQIIAQRNPDINAFVHVSDPPPFPPDANSNFAELPLLGVSIAIKDNIATKFAPTTCSSAILKDYTSPFDATVVQLLRQSGADIIGKTNCDEFGMGSLNIHSVHGPVVNPSGPCISSSSNERRSAGGSSGGSAAAVAANMCHAALGTDTGGSIRLPASYCGVVGLKPSYGLISRWGVVSFADSLDCVGIMSKDISMAQKIFNILSFYDTKDPTAVPPESRILASNISQKHISSWGSNDKPLEGLRIGIPQEYFPTELSKTIISRTRRTISTLKAKGAQIIPVSLPSTPYALSAYYVLASAEASSNMARYDGVQYGTRVKPPPNADLTKTSKIYAYTRSLGFGQEVQKRIILGTYALSASAFDNYFLQAQRVRQLVKDDFNKVFNKPDFRSSSNMGHPNPNGVDVLLHPSSIRTAPPLSKPTSENSSEQSSDLEGLDTYVQDVLTVPASLAGLPALSIPATKSSGEENTENDEWPVGISIVGQWGCEKILFKIGQVLESDSNNQNYTI